MIRNGPHTLQTTASTAPRATETKHGLARGRNRTQFDHLEVAKHLEDQLVGKEGEVPQRQVPRIVRQDERNAARLEVERVLFDFIGVRGSSRGLLTYLPRGLKVRRRGHGLDKL